MRAIQIFGLGLIVNLFVITGLHGQGSKDSSLDLADASVFKIPPDIQQALIQAAPDFKSWKLNDYPIYIQREKVTERSTHFAVLGDFNGDKKTDLAILGQDTNSDVLLCVLSKKNGYTTLRLKEWRKGYTFNHYDNADHGVQWGVGLVKPGPHYFMDATPVYLGYEGIALDQIDREHNLFYYNYGKFHEVNNGMD